MSELSVMKEKDKDWIKKLWRRPSFMLELITLLFYVCLLIFIFIDNNKMLYALAMSHCIIFTS